LPPDHGSSGSAELSDMVVSALGLQVVPLGDDEVALRRGPRQSVLRGADVRSIIEPVVGLLDGRRTVGDVVASFAGPQQPQVDQLLRLLVNKRFVEPGGPALPDATGIGDQPACAFFASLGLDPTVATAALASAQVVLVGRNHISKAIASGLESVGLTSIVVVDDPVLSSLPVQAAAAPVNGHRAGPADESQQRPSRSLADVLDPAEARSTIVVATCDGGEVDTLLDVNRSALERGVRSLSAWLADLVGFVGPLVQPHETACLRCYRLRAAANDPSFRVTRALGTALTSDDAARRANPFLGPMASVVGNIAAMELVKAITSCAPLDTAGAVVEVNLVSFRSTVRRVLKVPRCPDCSSVVHAGPRAVLAGPQIPNR